VSDTPDEPVRPTQDTGDLYVYSDADVAELCAEVFAQVREYDGVDDDLAERLADGVYELFTSDLAQAVTSGDTSAPQTETDE